MTKDTKKIWQKTKSENDSKYQKEERKNYRLIKTSKVKKKNVDKDFLKSEPKLVTKCYEEIIKWIEKQDIIYLIEKNDDFGLDFFPKLLNMDYDLFGLKSQADLIAIDTPELLEKNSISTRN